MKKIPETLALRGFGPTYQEFLIYFGISLGILILLTVNDMEIFDAYPLPIMTQCWEEKDPYNLTLRKIDPIDVNNTWLLENETTGEYTLLTEKQGDAESVNMTEYMDTTHREYFCNFWRERLNVEESSQLDFGIPHWNIQTLDFIFLSIVLGSVRTSTSWLWQKRDGQRILTWAKGLMGLIWFLGTLVLFYFGFLDLFYYIFQGDWIFDEKLDHLNGVGFFTLVQNFGESSDVEPWDLLLLNIFGGIGYIILWPFAWWAANQIKKETEGK